MPFAAAIPERRRNAPRPALLRLPRRFDLSGRDGVGPSGWRRDRQEGRALLSTSGAIDQAPSASEIATSLAYSPHV